MSFWYLTDFARVGNEKIGVEALQLEGWFTLSRWVVHEYRFAAEGVISVKGASYPVRLVYSDQYPTVPCWVEPQDNSVRWSDHQYGAGGALCLELRPDNWSPLATGADMMRSAYNLLSIENPLGEGEKNAVPSAHHITSLQSYDWSADPVLLSASCAARLRLGAANDLQAMTWPVGAEKWSTLITDSEDREQVLRPPAADFMTWRIAVAVTHLTGDGAPPDANRAAFAEAFGKALSEDELKGSRLFVVVDGETIRTYYSSDAEKVTSRPWVELPEEANMRAGRAVGTCAKKVAIVGLGSVGSKIAEILARADTRHMVLIDGDVMLPGNIERHILDWRDVGVRKVEGVARRLLQIAPSIDITKVPGNLNWQVSAKGQSNRVDAIAGCDLIVDATGDPATTMMLGAIAHASDRPFLTASVFEGGLGCVIARSIPGRDPVYADGREGYLGYCREVAVEPPKSGTRRYESLTDDGVPIVADDAAVTITAGHVGRIALDILDDRVEKEEAAWLLLGFRKGWLFHHHGHAIAIDVGPPLPARNVDNPEAQMFAMALVKEAINAAKAAE